MHIERCNISPHARFESTTIRQSRCLITQGLQGPTGDFAASNGIVSHLETILLIKGLSLANKIPLHSKEKQDRLSIYARPITTSHIRLCRLSKEL